MLIALAAAAATCLLAAAPALADTGSVYFDSAGNAAAGDTNHLFNATFTGTANVGIGETVMPALTTGVGNVALGYADLEDNTVGYWNTATGDQALLDNTTGDDNVATGFQALADTSGNENVGIGYEALAISEGDDNVALGTNAGLNIISGSNDIDIGNEGGSSGESRAIRIGTQGTQKRTFLAGVSGTTLSGPAQPVLVKANGQLGTASAGKAAVSKTTDRRFARMEAEMTRLQRQNERQAKLSRRLAKEVRALRANG
jgi:hypothetical protein